jgi:hypothetical protein
MVLVSASQRQHNLEYEDEISHGHQAERYEALDMYAEVRITVSAAGHSAPI